MRAFHLSLTVGTLLALSSASLIAGETPENTPFISIAPPPQSGETSKDDFYLFTHSRPAPLPAAKADAVKSGRTLKQLVELLGRGFMPQNSGAGIVAWYFADGRELWLTPGNGFEASNIATFDAGERREEYSHLLWHQH